VIADVSGKGVSAAFYMAEVKGIILSLSKVCSTPKELLLFANQTLMESLDKNAFISAIYGVLDTRNATITLARAGHCPAVHISGESVELVKPNGLGLGLTSGPQFEQEIEERSIKLQKGDICIFYTDGITEARNADMEEYGYERLMQIAKDSRNYSADELKDRILYNVRTFIGQGTYNDDVTLIVVKWLGDS
jgi:serine phosphatase RsbU (regulator of sigma subunit)